MMVDLYFYRDPEAEENKDTTDDTKAPGVDDVGPAAIDQGFTGNAEWEVQGASGAGAFASASNTAAANTSWEAEGGADWAASAPAEKADAEVHW